MADGDKAKILVVDDLPEKLFVYQTILEELGEELISAQSGAEALKQVLCHDFAVVLLDVNMPDMDGFETAMLIRKRQKSAHTPIIFITAFADDVRPLQGYAHGAVDYILAPVQPVILRAKVKVFVDLFRLRQQVEQRALERITLSEEQAKRAAAEEANRSSTFLARASATLANSLDLEATLRGVARSAVPFLADLSMACLADERARPRRMEWAWAEPAGLITSTVDPRVMHPVLARAVERVMSTRKQVLLSELVAPAAAGDLGGTVASAGHSLPGPELKLNSALLLPLGARDKLLGCIVLAFAASGRRYGPGEITVAADLAWRAGIALDNASLVRNIQEADRRKDEFLAMLAHELRNPLAPIRNAVECLRLTGLPDAGLARTRDIIDRQLTHLNRLVDDLLDVSRITRGKIRLQLESLDLGTVVVSAVESTRSLIESRGHDFNLSLPPEPIQVKVDPARLSQVLSNLLNNAAKYTDNGGHIWLTVEREGNEAVVRIRDTGAGIPSEMLPHIFEPFIQANQSLDRSQGGLGIGLTLVRDLVEMHGGSVEALSAGPGQGSEFVVRLAVLVDSPSGAEAPASTRSPMPFAMSRILVVDDSVDAANSLAMVLRLEGHDVRTAHDGHSALEAAQAIPPEIVLLDIGLPNMDGYEVARRLREHRDKDQMLVVAITGYGRAEDRQRSELAGFDHHLVKPIDFDVLRRLISRCADKSHRLRRAAN
jgi:signal transduction histidine kinase/CheY-like chemotaxis protein